MDFAVGPYIHITTVNLLAVVTEVHSNVSRCLVTLSASRYKTPDKTSVYNGYSCCNEFPKAFRN